MKSLFKFLFGSATYSAIHDPMERYVASQLEKTLPKTSYAVINNVLIPKSGKIGSSQIDHVVVSIYGVFCIETKKHAGVILASKIRRIFTQKLWNRNYRISPNPVEQNYSHIKALEELLGQRIKQPIVNIVVFPSAYRFYIDGYHNVGSVDDMITTMSTYTTRTYRFNEAEQIIKTICNANMRGKYNHTQHVKRVKAVYS